MNDKTGNFDFYPIGQAIKKAREAKALVIPNFGITSRIPNKEDIPKFIQEPLQYKDFLKKTSG